MSVQVCEQIFTVVQLVQLYADDAIYCVSKTIRTVRV